mmetsp:Transcript_7948/g.18150  ORF Transcript_7948/g.18150 Transcript_7948/m.18150 type:complete len:659 (+) Transcript_7948:211-2187(+)
MSRAVLVASLSWCSVSQVHSFSPGHARRAPSQRFGSMSEQVDVDLGAAIAAGGGAASVVAGETPFRWVPVETDFCLIPQDSSVSGASITKTLNRFTNRMAREALVRRPALGGLGEVVESPGLVEEIPGLRAELAQQGKATEGIAALEKGQFSAGTRSGGGGGVSQAALEDALRYFDCVAATASGSWAQDACGDAVIPPLPESASFITAYERFESVLAEFGYRGGDQPMEDRNFCLSMLDQLEDRGVSATRPVVVGGGGAEATSATSATSATRQLNALANQLQRTLLYGETPDVDALALGLENGRGEFEERFGGGGQENNGGGEALAFYDALILLMRDGLRCQYSDSRLKDSYLDGFQRLLDSLVESLGETALGRGTRKDLVMLSEFALWEREVRLNITGGIWEEHPDDMVGGWVLVESDTASLLSSASTNTFNYASGGGTSRARPFSPLKPSKPAIVERRTFSGQGKYRYDAAVWGEGGRRRKGPASALQSMATKALSKITSQAQATPAVLLEPGGRVKLSNTKECEGVAWRLDPGPTHLDTCYIVIRAPKGSFAPVKAKLSTPGGQLKGSGSESGANGAAQAEMETLTFMGYIDRGQRIESRFSGRAVRMSGLVATSPSDLSGARQPTGEASSRFVMEKAKSPRKPFFDEWEWQTPT